MDAVINDKSQGRVATDLRCAGFFDVHTATNLLLRLLINRPNF